MSDVKRRIDEFHARNGGDCVQFGEWIFYPNGASRELDPMGALIDPPKDDFERLSNALAYHRTRLAKAVKAFDSFKEQLAHQPCGNGEEISRLKELQRIVGERSKAMDEAKTALENTTIGRMRKGAREADQERMVEQAEWQGKLREIRI